MAARTRGRKARLSEASRAYRDERGMRKETGRAMHLHSSGGEKYFSATQWAHVMGIRQKKFYHRLDETRSHLDSSEGGLSVGGKREGTQLHAG